MQGGVETHAQNICPILVNLGCDVHVLTRAFYQNEPHRRSWKGIRFHNLWSPKVKGVEAFIHTFIGVLYAGLINRPDVLHIHAVGPMLFTPLARLFGLKVVVTHHGPDYDRQKWSSFAKKLLRLGECMGMQWASERIVISSVIRKIIHKAYSKESVLIPNGVSRPAALVSSAVLDEYSLTPGRYIVLVSRLVPEKRHIDLIKAFDKASGEPGLEGWKLAIVGSAEHPDDYTQEVLVEAENTENVICTGFKTGADLETLYTNAGIFVLPSSHEGLPIAMLEALSYGLSVIVSDIPANLEVGLPEKHYFPLGDVDALSQKLVAFSSVPISEEDKNKLQAWVTDNYSWDVIAQNTLDVYKSCG